MGAVSIPAQLQLFKNRKIIYFLLKNRQFQLNSYPVGDGKGLKVNVSEPNKRLFVGNIPKNKTRDDIFQEFVKQSGN